MTPTLRVVTHALAVVSVSTAVHARSYTWTGMRAPCKVSAEDGLRSLEVALRASRPPDEGAGLNVLPSPPGR